MRDDGVGAGAAQDFGRGREDRGFGAFAAFEHDEPEVSAQARFELLGEELHGQPALVAVVGIGDANHGDALIDPAVAEEMQDVWDGLLPEALQDGARIRDGAFERLEPFDFAGADLGRERGLQDGQTRAARGGDGEDADGAADGAGLPGLGRGDAANGQEIGRARPEAEGLAGFAEGLPWNGGELGLREHESKQERAACGLGEAGAEGVDFGAEEGAGDGLGRLEGVGRQGFAAQRSAADGGGKLPEGFEVELRMQGERRRLFASAPARAEAHFGTGASDFELKPHGVLPGFMMVRMRVVVRMRDWRTVIVLSGGAPPFQQKSPPGHEDGSGDEGRRRVMACHRVLWRVMGEVRVRIRVSWAWR